MADEGGVWRTIGGRKVFIRDGQSLSEAMRESGKFKNKRKSQSPQYGVKHRVYGKAEGQIYEAIEGNQYPLTGEKAGQTIEVPENETGEFEVYKAPRVSGFVDGKYVEDENVNTILSDGRIVLNDHDFNNDQFYKVRALIEAETLRLSGFKKEGEFFRGTDNKDEINYLKNGTMRPSTNHMTGEAEDGVSVWEYPKYSFKYQYRVSGEIVGIGSDGEPVLDPKTIQLVSSKSYGTKDYELAMEKGKSIFCETYGWTEEQYDQAKTGRSKTKKRL